MKLGIGYLPEDRKQDGIVDELSVRENIILALQVMRGFFRPFSRAEAEKFADEYIKLLGIKTASTDTPIKSLSAETNKRRFLRDGCSPSRNISSWTNPRAASTSAPRSKFKNWCSSLPKRASA